jgi:hypothetical protein
MGLFFDILFGLFTTMKGLAVHWADMTVCSGCSPSLWHLFVIVLLVSVWLGGAFVCADLAERKSRSRPVHFTGGLIFPLVYTALIWVLPEKRENPKTPEEIDTEKRHSVSEEMTKKLLGGDENALAAMREAAKKQDERKKTQDDAAQRTVYGGVGQKYFSEISVDSSGARRGPFIFELADGHAVEVTKILEAFPEFVEIETPGEGGKLSRIRLPYQRIKKCALKDDWIKGRESNSQTIARSQ